MRVGVRYEGKVWIRDPDVHRVNDSRHQVANI